MRGPENPFPGRVPRGAQPLEETFRLPFSNKKIKWENVIFELNLIYFSPAWFNH
jgi:hypothetical protein